jgi:hypothetical protein
LTGRGVPDVWAWNILFIRLLISMNENVFVALSRLMNLMTASERRGMVSNAIDGGKAASGFSKKRREAEVGWAAIDLDRRTFDEFSITSTGG